MEIRWRGHSCFELRESTGTVVLCDPFFSEDDEKQLKSDIVTVSHGHSNHCKVNKIKNDFTLLKEVGFFEEKGVTVVGTKSFHDDKNGKLKGENIVFKIRMDGIDVCHLGDIGQECDVDIVSDILPVDVLLVPIGGEDTIDAEQAKEYIDALMPDIVIPMHFREGGMAELDKLESFLRLFDDEQIEVLDENFLQLSRDNLQHDSTKVVVMKKYLG